MVPRSPAPLTRPKNWSGLQHAYNQAAALHELRLRADALHSVRSLARLFTPTYIDGEFNKRLGAVIDAFLDACEAGQSPRVMIFAPPRSGKSELISRMLPLRILGRHPEWEVIAASASQDLSDEFGLFVRNRLNDPLYTQLYPDVKLDPSSNAVSRVTTLQRGGYRAVGIGTQVVGRGANIAIVDDPIKGRKEAYSQLYRDDLYAWYRANMRTRLAPGGGIIIMHQRWHPDDLAGTLLALAKTDPDADHWQVHSFAALAEAPTDAASTDDWREPGEPLFPERWPLHEMLSLKASMLPEEWLAMYQQRPVRAEGGFFKAEWFQFYSSLPKDLNWYLGVDFAASTSTYADSTAIFPVGISSNRDLYVAPDFFLGRMEAPAVAEKLLDLADKYKVMGIACDNQVLDKVFMPFLRERMRKRNRFYSFQPVKRTEGKHIVAIPLQARMQSRSVWWPDNKPVRETVVPQFLNFIPDADNKHDDAIDALANSCQMLDKLISPAPAAPLPSLRPEDEEEARWEKILSQGLHALEEPVPFQRLNGDSYKRACMSESVA